MTDPTVMHLYSSALTVKTGSAVDIFRADILSGATAYLSCSAGEKCNCHVLLFHF